MLSEDELYRLLAPISEDSPAGEALEFEGTYDAIREAKREDDATLPQGIWETARKKADWRSARDLCLEALAGRSKDLQVAIWLLESCIALDGFAGARFGLRLLQRLCEEFWDDMYPKIEGEDLEYRLFPFEWMNEKLSYRLKLIPLTAPAGDGAQACSWADLEGGRRLEHLSGRDPNILKEAQKEGAATVEKFNASLMLTPNSAVWDLHEELEGSLEALDDLRNMLREKCGNNAPSLARFREVLEGIRHLISSTLRSRGISEEIESPTVLQGDPVAVMEQESDASAATTVFVPAARTMRAEISGEIRSRTDAYAMLAAIADYLMKIEPHSPTPYLVKRAVSWGAKPLPALLHELMEGKNGDLEKIYLLLGINEMSS